MTITDLQKKVAEVLGVSNSEKELAFDMFILKLCDLLSDEVTLKVQRVGFFQMKKGFTKTTAESLLFIPLSEELYRDSKNLYLTIPIPTHRNVEEEPEADVFSIGVGKPILPLSESDSHDTETSYAILRKSIEERIGEILSEADQLPDFNIWDDYYNSVKYVEHEEKKDTLNELTSDLDFKEEFMTEDLTKNLLKLSAGLNDEPVPGDEEEQKEVSINDLLKDYLPEQQVDSETQEIQNSLNDFQTAEGDDIVDQKTEAELENEFESNEESGLNKEPELKEETGIDEEFEPKEELELNEEAEIENKSELNKESDFKEDSVLNGVPKIEQVEQKTDANEESELNDELEKVFVQDLLEVDSTDNELNNDEEENVEQESPQDELEKILSDINKEEEEKSETPDLSNIIENEKESDDEEFDFDKVEEVLNSYGEDVGEQASQNENEENPEDLSEEENNALEITVPTQSKEVVIEIKRESKLDDVDLEAAKEDEDVEPIYYLGLKKKEGGPIEWDWGDELKEEFGVEFLKEEFSRSETIGGEAETIDEAFKTTTPTKPTLFEELDSTIKKEIEKTGSHQVLEYSGAPTKYRFVEDESKPELDGYQQKEILEEEMEGNKKEFSFGKIFFIIFSSFVVVTSLIVYFLMKNNTGKEQMNTPPKAKTENYSLQQNPSEKNPADTMQILEDEYSDFPRVASLPVKGQTQNTAPAQPVVPESKEPVKAETKKSSNNSELYKTLETDTRVGKTIYFDGKSYNYQTSSWRNRAKAEQEVKRLRKLGVDAFLTEAYLPQKGGTWYRVRIGSFKSKEEAERGVLKNNF
jgi:cell division septation protein DedD